METKEFIDLPNALRLALDFKLIPEITTKAKFQEIYNQFKRSNFEGKIYMNVNEFMEFLGCLGYENFKG